MAQVVARSSAGHATKRRRLLIAGADLFATRKAPPRPLDLAPLENWVGSVGFADDVAAGPLDVTHVFAGYGHSLVAYRTANGIERVLSIGRNEAGQLGVGYNSAERTRGLVEGFEGKAITSMSATAASSFLLVRQHDSRNALYGFGSRMRGQLGLSAPVEEDKTPRTMHMSSRATLIDLPHTAGGDDRSIASLAVGFEHALALCDDGSVLSTGANPDGQLGLGDQRDRDGFTELELADEIRHDGVRSVHAGADTSAVITSFGRLWTFGNSEYAQALHGRPIDCQPIPLAVNWPSPIREVAFGGSFALLLDDQGHVHTAGYGALGLGLDILETAAPTRVDALSGFVAIRAAYGYAAAFTETSVHIWGLGSAGQLGFGKDVTRLFEPRRLELPVGMEDARIVDVQLGGETALVVAEHP